MPVNEAMSAEIRPRPKARALKISAGDQDNIGKALGLMVG
jgi:hypothetical protein